MTGNEVDEVIRGADVDGNGQILREGRQGNPPLLVHSAYLIDLPLPLEGNA